MGVDQPTSFGVVQRQTEVVPFDQRFGKIPCKNTGLHQRAARGGVMR